MSKIIFVVLVSVFLYGCGTPNPGMQAVQQGVGVAGGAALGWYGSKALGANRPVAMVSAVAGGALGAVVVRETQCFTRGDCPKTGTQQGSGDGYYPGTHDAAGVRVAADPGFVRDYGGGADAQVPIQYVIDNPCYLDNSVITRVGPGAQCAATGYMRMDKGGKEYAATSRARRLEQQQQQVVAQTSTTRSNSGKWNKLGLTVDNYRDSADIPRECKTNNPGRNSACLLDKASELDQKQRECVSGKGSCSNDWEMVADSYRNLSDQIARVR